MVEEFSFKNKNVVFILKSFVLGGAEKQALHLAHHLKENFLVNVYIYSYIKVERSDVFYKECELLGLENLFFVKNPLSASGRFKYLKRRIKILLFGLNLRKHNPDVIIPYLNPPSIIAVLSRKISGAKYTFWHHRGTDYYRADKLERKAVQKAPLFIANSGDGRKELMKTFSLTDAKSFFLPNFSTIVNTEIKKEIVELEKTETKIVIGMVAHFRVQKLQNQLLEAFHRLVIDYDTIHLVLAGNVYEDEVELSNYNKVTEYIKKHKLSNRVTVIHNVTGSSVLPYLDIGVLISIKEGMPNTIMEYMAYKLPIVATEHEGVVSLLGDEYNFYIENDNIDCIEEKLKTLIESKNLRATLGIANEQRLKQNFTIDQYMKKLTLLLNS